MFVGVREAGGNEALITTESMPGHGEPWKGWTREKGALQADRSFHAPPTAQRLGVSVAVCPGLEATLGKDPSAPQNVVLRHLPLSADRTRDGACNVALPNGALLL